MVRATVYAGPTSETFTTESAASEAKTAIVEAGIPNIDIPNVIVTVSTTTGVEEETVRGGARLTLPGTNTLSCTSAFTVKRVSDTSNQGILTARHCFDPPLWYSGRDVLAGTQFLTAKKGDVLYRRSTESVGTTFYYAPGETRKVFGAKTPVKDQLLCLFGRTTKGVCDYVKYPARCFAGSCNYVQMRHHFSDHGDSGGPWYSGHYAYGIHDGAILNSAGNPTWSYFTPVKNILSGMDLQLKK